jgi:CubicO group peptidase (beta-lactamase class C family)
MNKINLISFFLLSTFTLINGFSQTIDSTKLYRVEQSIRDFEINGFNGIVLIAKGAKTFKTMSTGFVDKNRSNAITNKTIFNIASIAKSFTAIAILQLNEKGLLDINDPINKYLPNIPVKASAITIHHLLLHQSGLSNNYAADGEKDMNSAIKKIFSSPLESNPGDKFLYSNNNYCLLAMIIEKVCKTNWEGYIQECILKPMAMNSTIFWQQYHASDLPKVLPRIKLKSKIKERNYGYVGSTGIFCNAEDLLKLNLALSDTTLLTSQSIELLHKGFINLSMEEPFEKNSYGYGVFVKSIGDKKIISLRGNEQGWGNAISYYFIENGLSIIVLSNVDELNNGKRPHIEISNEIIRILKD